MIPCARRRHLRVVAVPVPHRVTVCHPRLGVVDMHASEATSGRRRTALFIGRPHRDVEVFDERAEAERVARDRGWIS